MICNRCNVSMMFSRDALVPAMMCPACGRFVPVTGAPPAKASKRDERTALRAARRVQLGRRRAAT